MEEILESQSRQLHLNRLLREVQTFKAGRKFVRAFRLMAIPREAGEEDEEKVQEDGVKGALKRIMMER